METLKGTPSHNEGFGVRRGVVSCDTSQDFGSSAPVRAFAKPRPNAKPRTRCLQACGLHSVTMNTKQEDYKLNKITKMKKHLFTGFIALMMCSVALSAQTSFVPTQNAGTWDVSATAADHVTATLANGTLTISGTGAIKDGINMGSFPWYPYSVTSVVIEQGVTAIGDYALASCAYYVNYIKLPKSLTKLGAHIFDPNTLADSPGLQTIEVEWDTPVAVTSDVFAGLNLTVRTLIVPTGSVALYKAANVWKNFQTITSDSSLQPPASVFGCGVNSPTKVIDYQGIGLIQFSIATYYDGTTLVNPFDVRIGIAVNSTPVNVIYSMYSYKPTFSQSGKRNYIQGIAEAEPGPTDPPIRTMADVNADLDKIYEFPVVTETATGIRHFDWDGYTDPLVCGKKLQVNDAVWLIAQNADNGELLGLAYTNTSGYGISSGVLPNYTAGEKTISAKITLGYDDKQPFKKLTAAIMTENCGWGALPYSAVSQGTEAMLANINSRLPGDVLAYAELTNPTVDADNPNIKYFEWNDIEGLDGKPWISPARTDVDSQYAHQYMMAIIEETDIPTFTGINAGSIFYGILTDIPSPTNPDAGINNAEIQNLTLYPNPVKDELNITAKNPINKVEIYSLDGKTVMQENNFAGKMKVSSLVKGVYMVKVYTLQGVETVKIIKN